MGQRKKNYVKPVKRYVIAMFYVKAMPEYRGIALSHNHSAAIMFNDPYMSAKAALLSRGKGTIKDWIPVLVPLETNKVIGNDDLMVIAHDAQKIAELRLGLYLCAKFDTGQINTFKDGLIRAQRQMIAHVND